jgi:site-specific recombinase XerD
MRQVIRRFLRHLDAEKNASPATIESYPNDRILSAHSREVTFSYRDRKNQDRKKTMTLDAHEFIRRFLLHVIPKGFVRVLELL